MFGLGRKEKGNNRKAIIYINDCSGCGDCIQVCRKNAIGFYELSDGKYAKLVNPERCTGCGKCIRVCENKAIEIIKSVSWKN